MSQATKGIACAKSKPAPRMGAAGTAEAFYRVFRALPRKERIAIAHYILADAKVQKTLALPEMPNETTSRVFSEDKQSMSVFDTVDELQRDLLS